MIRHPALLYLTPFLIPLLAFAKPPVLPQAAWPVQVPISTQFVGTDGQTYILSGTLTLQVGTITPPPPDLKVAYVTMAPPSVTAGQNAMVTVVMTRAALQGTQVALSSADPSVQVQALLTIPEGRDFASANVATIRGVATEKLVAVAAKYGTSGGYSNLRVLPDSVTPPPVPGAGTPLVSAYLNMDGTPVVNPIYGQILRITGIGFGLVPGKVYWQGGPVLVQSWGDTEIRVKLPTPVFTGPTQFSLQTATGLWVEFGVPTDGPGRVPGSARRR